FREKGQEQDEFVYDRFWSSLLRWLLSFSDFEAGNDVALSAQRRLVTDEEPFQFEIRSRNIDPQAYRPRVIITGPNDVRVEVEPRRKSSANIGTFIAEAGPFAPGEYRVELHNNVGSPSVLTT